MKPIFDVSLDNKKLAWGRPPAVDLKSPRSAATGRDHESLDVKENDSCNLRLDHLRQHAANHVAICATLLVLAMLQLLFMHYDVQIIASTYTVVLCPLVLAVYVQRPHTKVHVVFLHYISVYVLLAHYEQDRDMSWLLSCWALGVFTHLACMHRGRKDAENVVDKVTLAALGGLIVVNATALALRLLLFSHHTAQHENARAVSHLAHGGLLLLNAAAYACLRQ